MVASRPPVAPTQKISDDVKWTDTIPARAAAPPPKQAYPSMPPQMPAPQGAVPVAQYRPSTPPPDAAPVAPVAPVAPIAPAGSAPPTNRGRGTGGIAPIAPVAPVAPAPSSSLDASISPPKRGKGLIIFVLIVDLGLAGVGVYLLLQGLGKL